MQQRVFKQHKHQPRRLRRQNTADDVGMVDATQHDVIEGVIADADAVVAAIDQALDES